jgi:molybdopterin-guanine dinucleotide biosynthesis protein A
VLSAVILSGGRSSRMGTPKCMLPFDGEPLIQHIVRKLQPLFTEIVVVASPGQPLPPLPVTVVHDTVAYQGPVGGIYYGLGTVTSEWAFVTSCDSAFLNMALVSYLVSQRVDFDVVVPRWDNRLQPLVAMYRKTVVSLLEKQLADGELRPVHLFDKVSTRYVDEHEIRRLDPEGQSFFNMNRPEDYAEALTRWSQQGVVVAGATLACTVELFGVAQMTAKTRQIALTLPAPATVAQVYRALAEKLPALNGSVIAADGEGLAEGYACNVNGLQFVRSMSAPVNDGDSIALFSADAGG